MKRKFFLLAFSLFSFSLSLAQETEIPRANEFTIEAMRRFSKDLLDQNAVPYMQPLVTSINATSNSRFFNQAKVPKKVDRPYFRFGIHTMIGFINEDQKTYKPSVPMIDSIDATKYALQYLAGKLDTAGAFYDVLRYLLKKTEPSIRTPERAATIFGSLNTSINIPGGAMRDYINDTTNNDPYLALLRSVPNVGSQLDSVVQGIPDLPYPLPKGQNMNTLIALVPQLEIGSFMGTEALIRYIPPVELDTNIGKFSFWGFGLKHSITQYFETAPFDAAIQAVYQGTSLKKDKIGETGASMNATGTIWNVNLQASKNIEGWFDVFTGVSFENTEISTEYTYYLPIQIQIDLGMIPKDKIPTAEKPGDTKPQKSNPVFTDTNYKWVIGIARQFGPIAIFADYNVSKFNIFSAGIEARF